MIDLTTFLILAALCFGCDRKVPVSGTATQSIPPVEEEKNILVVDTVKFSRTASFQQIKEKVKNRQPLVVHLRIPLCDNEHQGIVPVPEKLGNGFDLNHNLYWGAKYGFKHHFRKHSNWKLIYTEKNISADVLERVIFKKTLSAGGDIFIVADAYQGNKMKQCLQDYLQSVAGKKKETLKLESNEIGISSHADLIIFNGHNGLMDYDLEFVPSEDQIIRETSVIGCISHNYFKEHLLASKGYPLLMTTNLMAPEAYVVEAVIESWSQLHSAAAIRKAAGKAYHQYQKCGIRGATNLFRFGWD